MKLIKIKDGYELHDLSLHGKAWLAIAYLPKRATCRMYYLSKQNCDELFGVVDVMPLAHEFSDKFYNDAVPQRFASYIIGFNKHAELNKDKVFTEMDLRKAIDMAQDWKSIVKSGGRQWVDFKHTRQEIIKSLQQPTEIEVEFEMDSWFKNGHDGKIQDTKPKLDADGCSILKKI